MAEDESEGNSRAGQLLLHSPQEFHQCLGTTHCSEMGRTLLGQDLGFQKPHVSSRKRKKQQSIIISIN